MFITFEGIDGSGKSTQIELLKNRCDEERMPAVVFREPGGTEISEQIRSILLHAGHEIDPVTELLLFSSARSQLMAEKVLPFLKKGHLVILDRFFDSTTAYQGYGRGSASPSRIQLLNQVASHGCTPDLTFYLKLSLEEAARRTERQHKDRMEQSGSEFYQKVIHGFEELAKQESRIKTLDATLAEEQLHGQIWEAINQNR